MSSSEAEARAFELLRAGRHAEAVEAWRAIAERAPDDARALHFLGCAMAGAGRGAEALALVDRSLALEPRNAAFLNNRARILADAGRMEEAVADLRRALRWQPAFAEACLHLGLLLTRLGRDDEAIVALRRACALDSRSPGAFAGLGGALFRSADFAGARVAFERALALQPGDADLANNLGLALAGEGLRDEAIARYRQALQWRPGFGAALMNWGNALKDAGDLEGAEDLYRRAAEADPGLAAATTNRAGLALDAGRLDDARALYQAALARDPRSADARYGLGQIALRERRFAEGWAGYEARFETNPPQATWRDVRGLPMFTGVERRVAVWAEQGLGDQILFSTLVPELAARGVAVTIEVDARLLGMLRRAHPQIGWVAAPAADAAFAGCEAQVAMGSLPRRLRPDAESFARATGPLMTPDPARVAAFRERLGPGRWIGIAWRSLQKGEREALARRKSIPLEAFAALARASGARLLDLQYGDVDAERKAFDERHPGVRVRFDELDLWGDLEGVAAAIAACERVVTASNVTAHIAGAIGAPATVVCLNGQPPFHYWVPGPDGRSPWYRSVEVAADPGWTTWERALEALAARR